MGTSNTSEIRETDEIVLCRPVMEGIDIEEKPDKTNREVMIHGALENGDRFRISFKGDFKIKYETANKRKRELVVVYEEK